MLSKISYYLAVFIVLLSVVSSFVPVKVLYAATNFSVSPLLIDHTSEGRDIFTRSITLTNLESRPTRVYASVHEVKVGDKTEILDFVPASMSDRSTSVTSWIEITRGRLELPPSGILEVPLTVRVHPETPPGVYHAYIGFASGANRDEIEAKIKSGQGTGVLLKISIANKQRELLHLVNFVTDRFSFGVDKNNLTYIVENTGDVPLTPVGEIIVYDAKGKELTSLLLNSEAVQILPGERTEFTEPLPFTDRLGKNKAYLTLEYGTANQANVFDTAFYYSVPWYYLAGAAAMLFALLLIVALVFRRAYQNPDAAYEDGVYEVPMYVKESHLHDAYDHDLNLKDVNKDT
jgi:hypothetical protein